MAELDIRTIRRVVVGWTVAVVVALLVVMVVVGLAIRSDREGVDPCEAQPQRYGCEP